jgi:hypothetical protein
MLLFIQSMKLLIYLLGLNKKEPKKIRQLTDQDQRDALIQAGRQQFKKLQELGLKIPIAVL